MEQVFTVPNISCGHCVATIERELGFVEGVESVSADQATKQVSVKVSDPNVFTAVAATLDEIGYPSAGPDGKVAIALAF